MVMDYKGVSFSFSDIRKSKRIKRIRLVALGIAGVLLVVLLLNILDNGKVRKGQELLLGDKQEEARTYIQGLLPSLFHGSTKKELLALWHLKIGEYQEAQKIFLALGSTDTGLDAEKFLNDFADHANYRQLQIYTDFLLLRKRATTMNSLLFFKALYSSALFQYQQSEAIIAQMPEELKKAQEKAIDLIHRVNQQVQSGKLYYIFDMNDKPLAYYDLARQNTVSLTPGMNFAAFTPFIRNGVRFFGLTLDVEVQRKLQTLFRGLYGSFLMFNVADSSIVAAYSQPLQPPANATDNTVFTHYFEPGSIIKPLTLLTYLNTGDEKKKTGIFPLACTGNWQIGNKLFSDWTVHQTVHNADEAMAVSCNIAFAHMGVQLGDETLCAMLERFYFNSAPLKDQFLEFKTGKTGDTITDEYQLANMAVGLNHVTITTFHAALIFNIIADNGSVYEPYLLQNKKNLLNIGYYNHGPRLLAILNDNSAFLKVKNALVFVVESADGTGRRAKVDGLMMAVKTGTAGNKQLGLDAILTGFFPAEKPKYAFAFQLERAGKAELKGALFLKDFLNAFYLARSGNK